MDNGTGHDQEEIRKQIEARQAAIRQAQENEQKIRSVLVRILEPDAYDRIMNVKISNAELYAKAVNALAYYYNKVKRKITDQELKTLLTNATERREGSFEIRRK